MPITKHVLLSSDIIRLKYIIEDLEIPYMELHLT